MTQPLQPEISTSRTVSMLRSALDETIAALSTFDAERLETLEAQVRTLSTSSLTQLAEESEALPELLRRHTLLGETLNATAANLRVVAAVLEAKRASQQGVTHDRSNPASWPR